jgi:hypothetical protein
LVPTEVRKMQRQLVTAEELVKLINMRVRQRASTRGCAIAGVLRLNKPDGDGCNWEEIGVKAAGTEGFRKALMEMRAAYNLEERV